MSGWHPGAVRSQTSVDGSSMSRSSKAHAIALKLEPFARQLIKGVRPIYLIEQPTPGTGATLLVNVFAQMTFGGPVSKTFLRTAVSSKRLLPMEAGPIKVFVQLIYRTFGTNPVPVSRPEGSGGLDRVGSLLDLYRIHSHELDLRFNDKPQESWPGLLGKAINTYKDRVYEITHACRCSEGEAARRSEQWCAVKRLELLPSADLPEASDRLAQ